MDDELKEINDLKRIKKIYGEEMMHLCRELFPTILEKKGELLGILKERFHPTRFLIQDIKSQDLVESFKNYIYSFFYKNNDNNEERQVVNCSPQELMARVGYKLYECHNDDEIKAFKHYYYRREELCTFGGHRLERCYVFFAVRDDADKLKREDFINPKREDKYGTSVISIQFSRGDINTLSIKNRYNHTVDCPDSTCSNNLDTIVYGLTSSFEEYYGLNIDKYNKSNFEIPGYVLANDGKYYKYNYEINNVYYCPDNIIIDNSKVIKNYVEEKERYLVLDYFIFDLKEKIITKYDDKINDSFIDDLNDIEKIKINNDKNGNKEIIITKKNENQIFITIDMYSRIIKYCNDSVKKVGDNFLNKNKVLEEIKMSSVIEIGDEFLDENIYLTSIDLSNVRIIGKRFLEKNQSLSAIKLPNIIKIGHLFLSSNQRLKDVDVSNVIEIGEAFLVYDKALTHIELPNVEIIGNAFLKFNTILKHIVVPNLKKIGLEFLINNTELESIELPNAEIINVGFLQSNMKIDNIELPNIRKIRDGFLMRNKTLKRILLPKEAYLSDDFIKKYSNIIEYVNEEEKNDDKSSHR